MSRPPNSRRGWRSRSISCSLSCGRCRRSEDVKLTGGLWIITERAVATESGEPVDPAQSALWGLGRTIITEQPALRCRLVDYDEFDDAVRIAGQSARRTRRGTRTRTATRKVLGAAATAMGARRPPRGAPRRLITSWSRPNAARSTTFVWSRWRCRRRPRARCRSGWRPQVSTSAMCSMCSACTRAIRGGSAVTSAGIVTEVGPGVTGFEVGQRVFGFMQGGFASRVNVPAQFLAPLPDGVSAVGAATIPAGALTTRLAFDWAKVGAR